MNYEPIQKGLSDPRHRFLLDAGWRPVLAGSGMLWRHPDRGGHFTREDALRLAGYRGDGS